MQRGRLSGAMLPPLHASRKTGKARGNVVRHAGWAALRWPSPRGNNGRAWLWALGRLFMSRRAFLVDQNLLAGWNSSRRWGPQSAKRLSALVFWPPTRTCCQVRSVTGAIARDLLGSARGQQTTLLRSGRGRLWLIRFYQYADRWLVLLIVSALITVLGLLRTVLATVRRAEDPVDP